MSFVTETPVKAVRKRHQCDACGRGIEAGSAAIRWAGKTDGDFGTAIYHPDCRAAEIGLNKVHQTGWYADEWMSLQNDMEFDDWPWLLDAHPAVAERMGITQSRYDAEAAEREQTRRAWAEIDRRRLSARDSNRGATAAKPGTGFDPKDESAGLNEASPQVSLRESMQVGKDEG